MTEPLTLRTIGLSWTWVRLARALSNAFLVIYALTTFDVMRALLSGGYAHPGLLNRYTVMAMPLLFVSYALWLTEVSREGAVRVDDRELIVTAFASRERRVLRSDIVGALVVERRRRDRTIATVEIELARGDRLTARFVDPSDARALVERLGFGAAGARTRSRLATPLRRLLHPVLAAFASIVGVSASKLVAPWMVNLRHAFDRARGGWTFYTPYEDFYWATMLNTTFVLIAYLVARRATRPAEIVVGDDGVLLERGLERSFFSRTELDRGEAPRLTGLLLDDDRIRAVMRLVAERGIGHQVGPAEQEAFARAGKTLATWRDDLRAKMAGGSYRAAATYAVTAATVLRAPDASPEARVGAAIALRLAGEPSEKIRVAAEAVVEARVRVALEAVADDADDAVLEKALRRLR